MMEEELDMTVPDDFTIEVHEKSANTALLVLPPLVAPGKRELQFVSGGHDCNFDWG